MSTTLRTILIYLPTTDALRLTELIAAVVGVESGERLRRPWGTEGYIATWVQAKPIDLSACGKPLCLQYLYMHTSYSSLWWIQRGQLCQSGSIDMYCYGH